MKTRAASQLIQAVLFMLAMVLGLLILPGKDLRSDQDCMDHDVPGTARPAAGLWTNRSQACSWQRYTRGNSPMERAGL